MRSTLLLAVLAAGAVDAFEKRVYVTDWTTVTITETVTAPAVTLTVPAAQQNQAPAPTSSIEATTTAAPQVSQVVADNDNSDHSELAKKSPAPEPEPVPEEGATTWATTWGTAWATTWGAEQPASTLATSSSTAQEPAATPSTDYQSTVLYNHNVHRSNHSANSLEWDPKLEQSALTLAKRCVYEHDTNIDGGGYGQNIGYGTSADEVGVMISNMMYNDEYGLYPWTEEKGGDTDSSKFDLWGHFSQIVWKGTTHVGCATYVCDTLGNVDSSKPSPFTVCNYSPAGNTPGSYSVNVVPGGTAPIYSV